MEEVAYDAGLTVAGFMVVFIQLPILKAEVIMATCEFCDTCSFFNEEFQDNPVTKDFLCSSYCNGHFTTCARYKIAMSNGILDVPHDLLPDIVKTPKCFSGI